MRSTSSIECVGCGQQILSGLDVIQHGGDCAVKIMRVMGYVRAGSVVSTSMLKAAGVKCFRAPFKDHNVYRNVVWAPRWAVLVASIRMVTRMTPLEKEQFRQEQADLAYDRYGPIAEAERCRKALLRMGVERPEIAKVIDVTAALHEYDLPAKRNQSKMAQALLDILQDARS